MESLMDLWLSALERLTLALVFGGGIVMGSCVRPILLQALTGKVQVLPAVTTTVDGIRIHSWERYNRMAFCAVLVLVVVQIIRSVRAGGITYIPMALSLLLVLALVRKLLVDQRLNARLSQETATNLSLVGVNERRELEVLSISILILSLLLILWPGL
jgi:hypothetical protein